MSKISALKPSGPSLQPLMKSPYDGIGGFVKRPVAKRTLQRPLKDQILDYKAVQEVCREDLKNIQFFDMSVKNDCCSRELLSVLTLVLQSPALEVVTILFLHLRQQFPTF